MDEDLMPHLEDTAGKLMYDWHCPKCVNQTHRKDRLPIIDFQELLTTLTPNE